ncbi:transcriptional regulatory protein [Diplodia corticola]|uniref:Transcriptional regulatory protein n=1 Tax=Diplodia corticola TaxID=236234 RepID=A0A1J9RE22_9PEZI|nr:transcriptional regulatory protein [Diplodia corticola]OJD30811.1 transcriptional regulatory protein [Diplodia corticola]
MAMASTGLDSLLRHDSSFLPEVWAWFGIGVTVILLRFGVRIRMVGFRGFAGDDYMTITTLAMYTCDAAFVDICYRCGTNVDVPPATIDGLTDPERERLRYGSKMQLAAWYSYTALIWCMKATLLFYKRLTFGLWQHRALKYLACFTAASFYQNWNVRPLPPSQCTLKKQNFLVTVVLNALTDAAILCIPLPMLRQLKAPLYKKALVALLLCSGLFVITAAIIRAAVTLGSSPSSITINRWGVRETIIGILSINAPILRPLFTRSFWTGVSVNETRINAAANAPAEDSPRRRKRVFGSKSSRSDNTESSGTPKKLSKSDSAAFGVDTNVPGYSVNEGDNSSQENMVGRDEEEGIELAPLAEGHDEEEASVRLQRPENVVYVERSYADKPPCDRCRAAGRADQCRFPPPGTSAIHRQSKRRRQTSGVPAPLENPSPSARPPPAYANDGSAAVRALFPAGLDTSLQDVDGFQLLTDEVKNSYLRCSYKWSFHHTPTLLARVSEKTLDPWVVWAILALAVRFSRHAPGPYATPTDASKAFAAHARHILQPEIETPSLSRIQALLMLTGHDWGAGNGRRAWFYLGMAIRMVQILNLCEEPPLSASAVVSPRDFIVAEERRRTAWTCFLMDSLLSGGKGRKRSLSAADMRIQLPCETDLYVFGEAVRCPRVDGSFSPHSAILPLGNLGVIGFSLRIADVWGAVASWACSNLMDEELPWVPTSRFHQLSASLRAWSQSLPVRLHYSIWTLEAHNALEQGQGFIYMHCIHFMSLMFLHRAYLPVLGPGRDSQTNGVGPRESFDWAEWRKSSRRELFEVATTVCKMVDKIQSFGFYFVRGLVPWIGFTIYTAVGVIVYRNSFHFDDVDGVMTMAKSKEQIVRGCTFLKEMKEQWPMAQQWFETIKRMQACYRRVHVEGGGSIPDAEQRTIRSAMIDYGALQPSPVQPDEEGSNQAVPSSNPLDASVPARAESAGATNPVDQVITDDAFLTQDWSNVDLNISDADLDAMFMNATQDFWASFPGEVGYLHV